jgi:integrase
LLGGLRIKVSELKNDLLIIEWFETLNPKPTTEKNYIRAMREFTEWAGKTPNELLTEAEAEIRKGLLMRERNIKRYLIGFRKYLQNEKYASTSVKTYMTGVTSFYKSFDIEIPSLPRSGNKAKPLQKNCEIPTKEDLQEVLKVCDPFEKAILLVGASSGLSANEIINLKVSDFNKGYDPETEITTLKLRREKVGFDFITFLSPEASRAVLDYLKYRERTIKTGEIKRINQLKKQRVVNDSGYLFIARQVPEEFLESMDEELRKVEENSFLKIYRKLSEKAQKNTNKGDWNLIRSHNVRKWFNSAMLNAGADSFHVEFFMGHTLDDTRAAYFRANPEKLRDLYQKYIPYLTVQREADISESPEYLRIKQENHILQAETVRHVVERSELQELRAEMKKIQALDTGLESLLEKKMEELVETRLNELLAKMI